ncbi:MAG: HEAT repeat domain-containing protein [Acidobacteriota bacterium]
MTCENVQAELPFLLYGELSFDEEEQIEQHLAGCASCRQEFENIRGLHTALDQTADPVPAPLLMECRRELRLRIREEAVDQRGRSWWQRLADTALPRFLTPAWSRPLGALAMLAVGFLGARLTSPPTARTEPTFDTVPVSGTRVRFVEPDRNGLVKITVEETRERMVTGKVDDARVRQLLLTAAQDPGDPGLRVETLDLLQQETATDDVREALIAALQSDENSGVRMKALQGLKRYATHPRVRSALTHVLLNDNNPGIRTQAIDLLVQHKQRDVVGALQQLMQREDNDYIRQRTQRLLRDLNASVDSF